MRKNHWKAVAVAAVLMMAVPALLAQAADKTAKTAKPAPADKRIEQPMPAGCVLGGPGMGMGAGQSRCCMHGGGMKAGMGKGGCCMQGDMKGCCMKGGMKGCCMQGDMKGCCMKGGMGKGMPGCGMRGGMGRGMEGGPMCGSGMGPRMGAGPGPMMLHGLDLTADQQKKVVAIHERAQRQMIQQQADLRIATMDLQQLMRAETPDRTKIDGQIDRLSQLRAGMQKARTATVLEVRALLAPEQLKKWREAPMGDEEEDD